jgi:hypothetical protein
MVVNNTTREILAAWQHRIEKDQEAGSTPVISLGESASLLEGLPGLIAYHELTATRTDLTSPFAQAGGSSALWYSMLSDRSLRAAVPLFTGVDAASVMALETLNARLVNPTVAGMVTPDRLPAGFIPHVDPAVVPGRTLRWSSLPFSVMNPAPTQYKTSSTDWAAVAAVFLALCMILLALVV